MMVRWTNPSEVRQQVENEAEGRRIYKYYKEAISNCFTPPDWDHNSHGGSSKIRIKGIQISQVLMEKEGHKRIAETEALITQADTSKSKILLRQLRRECKENTDTILECYVSMLEWEKPVPTVAMAYVIDRLRSEENILAAIEARLAWLGR